MKKLRNPIALLVLVIVIAAFSAPFGTPQLAAFAKDFLSAVATLVAAYAGAWYAASLVKEMAQSDERKRNISAGARAMFLLWRQLNTVAQIQMDWVEKYRNNPSAPVVMPPINYPLTDCARINLDDLGFFIDLGNVEVLENLAIAELRFLHAIEIVRERSKLHLMEIQPVLERIIPNGGSVPHAKLQATLGPRLFSLLIDQTRLLILRIDEAVKTLDAASAELHAALKAAFPEAKFPATSKPPTE